MTDRYHVLGLDSVRRPFKTFGTVSPSIPMLCDGMPFAAGGTLPSSGCRRRYVQLGRVHLPGDVTGNGDGGTEGNGQYIYVDQPASLLLVAGQVPYPHRAVVVAELTRHGAVRLRQPRDVVGGGPVQPPP
jgi:hypothetical protein